MPPLCAQKAQLLLNARPSRMAQPRCRGTSAAAARRTARVTAAPGRQRPRRRGSLQGRRSATHYEGGTDDLVQRYNQEMAERMGWQHLDNPYKYNHDRGAPTRGGAAAANSLLCGAERCGV